MEEAGLRFVTEDLDAFKRAMSDATQSVNGMTDNMGAQQPKVNGFQAMLTGAFTAISSAAIEMAVQAGKAVVGFVTDSIGAAGDFEQGMSVLRAASGASADEMKSLRETAIALGNDITLPATSAQSAAEVMTELVKAGLSVADSQNAAKGALQLATAAQVDEATAAAITAGVLNTFNMEGTEATKVADMLAAGANASSASITDLSQGTQQAGSIFAAYGLDADDLVTSIAMLTNVGLTGSDAGTSLKNAIVKLGAPTKEGAALMESLGIEIFDAQGNMKEMPDILAELNAGFAGMTQEQKNAALNTIVLSDGSKALLPLLEAGTEGFASMNAKINENGAAAKMAGAQTEGFKGAQAALANTLDTLQLIIGTALLPILTDLFNKYIIPGAQWVMSLVQSFISGEGATNDISRAVAMFGDTFGAMIGMFDGSINSILNFQDGFMEVASALGIPDKAAQGLSLTISSVVLAISTYVDSLKAVIFAVFGEIQTFIDAHGEEIAAVMQEAWSVIQLAIDTAVMYYQKVLAPALQAIAGWIREHGAEIQSVFTTVWNVIKFVIQTALTLISGILSAAMLLMQGDTEGALETLRKTFETIWNNIKKAVEDIVSALAKSLKAKFDEIKNGIVGALKAAYDAVVAQLKAWVELGAAIITGIIDGIKAQATALFNQVKDVITNAIRGAISIFPAFLQPYLLNFFGLGGASAQGKTASGFSNYSNTSYGNTYNLSLTTTAGAGAVMDSFAVMQAYG